LNLEYDKIWDKFEFHQFALWYSSQELRLAYLKFENCKHYKNIRYYKSVIENIRIKNTKCCVNYDRVSQELSEYI
jgi:hypothetical protein